MSDETILKAIKALSQDIKTQRALLSAILSYIQEDNEEVSEEEILTDEEANPTVSFTPNKVLGKRPDGPQDSEEGNKEAKLPRTSDEPRSGHIQRGVHGNGTRRTVMGAAGRS